MREDEFRKICEKIRGYDAIVMTDKASDKIHRYCFKPKVVTFDDDMYLPFTGTYGHMEYDGEHSYTPVGDSKVLYTTAETIHRYLQTVKQKLHSAIKDFK